MSKERFDKGVAKKVADLRKELSYSSVTCFPEIELIIETVLKREATKYENAGYGGEFYNPSIEVKSLNYFLYGLSHWNTGDLPKEYEAIVVAALKQKDPDYATYLKLKAKFEGETK